jgi:hypothetical protein
VDRFLIAPFVYKALYSIFGEKTKGSFMARKQRVDIKDMINQKFGDFTVLYLVGSGKYRGSVWKCRCICGKECDVYGGQLRCGARVSCGCRSESRVFETGINRVFSSYKRKASLSGKEFTITREEFGSLITGNCQYCGTEPGNELKRLKSKKLQIKYNGIDRFDTSKGYIPGNCVSCCYYCNHAKADLSFDQWVNHLKRICSYLEITNG